MIKVTVVCRVFRVRDHTSLHSKLTGQKTLTIKPDALEIPGPRRILNQWWRLFYDLSRAQVRN